MALSERITWLMELKGGKAVASEFESLGRTADRSLGKAEQRTERFAAGFKKAGAVLLSSSALAATGLYNAAQSASDLNEAANFSGKVFGDAAGEIERFAESAAKIGLSKRAALEATSSFGGLLQNLGLTREEAVKTSIDLTKLASDLASVKNTSPEEAILALGSALRGEAEPIRAYNVLLDDATVRQKAVELGLAATTAEVDNAAKTQARLALIYEQTADAQGDFTDTADGAANQARILAAEFENFKASIGEAALPVLQEVLGVLNGVVGAFNELPEPVQQAISKGALFATGIAAVGGGLALTIGKVLQLSDGLGTLATRFNTSKAAVSGYALALGAVVAIGANYLAERARTERTEREAAQAILDGADKTEVLTARIGELRSELGFLDRILFDSQISIDEVASAFVNGGDELAQLEARFKEFAASRQEGEIGFRQLQDAVEGVIGKVEELEGQYPGLLSAFDDFKASLPDGTDALEDNTAATADASAESRRFKQALAEQRAEVEQAEEALRSLLDATLAQFDSQLAAADAYDDARSAIEDYLNTTDDANTVVDESVQAQRDAERAILQAGAAAVASARDQQGAALTAQQEIDAQIFAYRALQAEFPALRGEIQTYIDALLAIPEERETDVRPILDPQALLNAQRVLDDLAENRTVTYTVNTVTTPIPARPASAGGGFQLAPINTNGPRSTGDGKSADIVVEVDGKELVRIVDEQLKREGGRVKLRG